LIREYSSKLNEIIQTLQNNEELVETKVREREKEMNERFLMIFIFSEIEMKFIIDVY